MLLIIAAMEDELKVARDLCQNVQKIQISDISLWQGAMGPHSLYFLKAGVGPEKSAKNLEKTLNRIVPDQILVVGYAGALDPQLPLGSLVAVTKASAFSFAKEHPDWDHVQLDGTYALVKAESLVSSAKSAGLNVVAGSVLSSSHVLGKPEHKNLLFNRFQASAVDMETAYMARVATSHAISMSCARTISDVAQDSFLEPFSYDPSAKLIGRAKKLFNAGMSQTYREWKNHAAVAKESLRRFLENYLQ
jgi:5'-methylthioadenosine/S-adenosylhomocysteine nucleosidase